MAKKRTRRTFSKEFKQEALQMCQFQSISEVARSLGIHENLLYKWKRLAEEEGSDAFRGRGNRTEQEERIRQLEAEVSRLKEEAEILKKASVVSTGHCNNLTELISRCRIAQSFSRSLIQELCYFV